MAMESEALPLIHELSLIKQQQPFPKQLPFQLYKGKFGGFEISLMTSGVDPLHQVDNVATIPATLMTYLAIEKLQPELIINAGTAGGIAIKGCAIGEVYLSKGTFCFHDRRIPIPGFAEYGQGSYPSYDTADMAETLSLKCGAVSTGNSLDLLDKDMEMIHYNGAIIKDMEAAAIGWVCQLFAVPLFAVKAITDLIDDQAPTQEQFLDNLSMASQNLQTALIDVLNYLNQKFSN